MRCTLAATARSPAASILAASCLAAHPHVAVALLTFSVGNSLTQDTRPQFLPDAEWHIYCGKNLEYIHDNPSGHCSPSSRQWNDALPNTTYDFVTVQPHFGTSLSTDASIIGQWMDLQPSSTTWVVHTGWAPHEDLVASYNGTWDGHTMTHHLDYFEALLGTLADSHPEQKIILNPAVTLLKNIADDIVQGIGPYNALSDLYRDSIHLSLTDGQYVQHNLLRTTMGLPINTEDFPDVLAEHATYLNSKIAELKPLAASVPEPSAWALGTMILIWCGRGRLRKAIATFYGRCNRSPQAE